MVRQAQQTGIGTTEYAGHGVQVALRMGSLDVGLRILDALFERSEDRFFSRALHGSVGFHDALCSGGMRPERHAGGAIEGISQGMVVVVVGVEGSLGGNLAHHAQSIELERGAWGGTEAFDQESGVLADKEATVAGGLKTL